jgi:hypothetical protein
VIGKGAIVAKPVKSNDPRKKAIVAALKLKSGANKITCVYEVNNTFEGSCLKGNRSGYENLGTFMVTEEEVGLNKTVDEKYHDDYTWDAGEN